MGGGGGGGGATAYVVLRLVRCVEGWVCTITVCGEDTGEKWVGDGSVQRV